MVTRRITRSVAALEELYNENEEDSVTENDSDTDDAVDAEEESFHDSETDADEEDAEEEAESEGEPLSGEEEAAAPRDAPPRKRGRPSYLHAKSGHKWNLSAPESSRRRSQLQQSYAPSTKGNATRVKTPLEAWSVLFTDEILDIIVKHTNEQVEREITVMRQNNVRLDTSVHKVIDKVELKATFGLLYYAGVHKLSKCKTINWWGIHSMPLFKAAMSRNRFTFILQSLRFDDKDTRAERKTTDRFTHIREIWEIFIKNCMDNYEPGTNTTIDEQLLSFRGRCSFKMYIPSKPDKYCLKIISLNDATTHYMINAIPYCGTVTDRLEGESIPTYYVRKLSEPLYNTERNITCDNWFTSLSLVEMMKKEHNLSLIGTIKKNKREIPAQFKNLSKDTPNIRFCYLEKKTLLSYNPKKKKIVLVLSSIHQTGKIDERSGKPEMIEFYNKTKGGTDCYDFKCHQYTTARKTSRWPVRSFYGMLDQAGVNSFILYNLNQFNAPLKRLDYLRELALQLVKPTLIKRLAKPTLRIGLRNTIEEFLDSRELPEEMDIRDEFVDNRLPKQKRCNLCPSSLDRKTYYKCLRCHKAMCKEHVAKLCCECGNTM